MAQQCHNAVKTCTLKSISMRAYCTGHAARLQASNGCKHKPSGQSFPRQRALHSAPAVVSNGTAMPQCCEDLHAEINLYACILYWACSTTASQQWVQAQQSGQSFPRQHALQLAPAVVSNGTMPSRHVRPLYACILCYECGATASQQWVQHTKNLAKVSRGSVHCIQLLP